MRFSVPVSLLAVLLFLPSPGLADPPTIDLIFGTDRLSATGQDVRSVRRIDEPGKGSALIIHLSPAFDDRMRIFTSAHVGETGALVICGQTVVEPHLYSSVSVANFVITNTDPAIIDRLEAMLSAPGCDPELSS